MIKIILRCFGHPPVACNLELCQGGERLVDMLMLVDVIHLICLRLYLRFDQYFSLISVLALGFAESAYPQNIT